MIIRSSSFFLPPSHPLTDRWRAAATMDNPEYAKHQQLVRANVRSAYAEKPPKTVQTWRVIPGPSPWAGGTMIPRGLLPPDLADEVAAELVDRRTGGLWTNVQLDANLRQYQREALDAFTDVEDGVVVMPCGAGKTTMGIGAIAHIGRRALVLVHTKDLAAQWIERIQGTDEHKAQLLNASVGTVFDGKRTDADADVVVATVQTLARWPWRELFDWSSSFGLVICDEAHHAPSATIIAVLGAIPARYRLGLTATPERHDGLTEILWHIFGGIAYQVTRADLIAVGAINPAKLTWHKTGISVLTHVCDGRNIDAVEAKRRRKEGEDVKPRPWAHQVSELVASKERNGQILDIAAAKVGEGHSGIVLSERVDHCKALAQRLRERGIPAEAVAGKQGRGAVAAILARARAGSTKVLCGTTKADEGLDVPLLSFGILATPTKAIGRVIQRLGRIERPGEMAPEWIDLVDDFPSAKRSAKVRRQAYAELGL